MYLVVDNSKMARKMAVKNLKLVVGENFESMQQDITILPYDIEKKYICIYIYDNTLMWEINQKLERANEELIDMSHRDPLT